MARDIDDVRELIRRCAEGDAVARRRFQDEFGADIYNFPVRLYGLPVERAADFYVYVFDGDRVFTRIRTFEGRNGIQFRTFLAYYVLKALFLEWQRMHRELETVSLATPVGDEGGRVLEDVLADPAAVDPAAAPAELEAGPAAALWSGLDPAERLDLKLLSLLECDLTPADVRLLAETSGRTIVETVATVEEVQASLRGKDASVSRLRDELDSTWGWILVRRRELQEARERIRLLGPDVDSPARRKLDEQCQALEAVIAKRMRQRGRILDRIRGCKVTTPYKDIARLLGAPVGTVCSRIFRLRQRLEALAPGGVGRDEAGR